MSDTPNNADSNAQDKSQLGNQVQSKPIKATSTFFLGEDADTVSTFAAIACGAAGFVAVEIFGHWEFGVFLWSLTIMCAAVALIAHANEKSWPPQRIWGHPWRLSIATAGIIVTGAIAAYVNLPSDPIAAQVSEGLLVPGDGPTPQLQSPDRMPFSEEALAPWPQEMRDLMTNVDNFVMADDVPANAVRIIFGKCVTWAESFPYTFIAQGDEDLMVLYREEGGIALSAKFFDSRGKIVCEIVKNKFFLNPSNYFRMESTANRLTVFDDETKCILDVEYINPLAIRISGEFFLRNRFPVVITDRVTNIGDVPLIPGTVHRSRAAKHPVAIWVDIPEDSLGNAGYWTRTKEALEAASERIKRDRPRIVVVRARVNEMVADKPIWCEIAIFNIGNSQALVTGSYALIFPEAEGKSIDQAIAENLNAPSDAEGYIEPGEVFVSDIFLLKTLSVKSINDILEGRARLFVFGRVYYWDSLAGQNRDTRFCLHYNHRTKLLGPYPQFNYID